MRKVEILPRTTRPALKQKQSKFMSLVETCCNTAIGYVIAVTTQALLFPLFGIDIPFSSNLLIGLVFTIISIARGYFVRRLFNRIF